MVWRKKKQTKRRGRIDKGGKERERERKREKDRKTEKKWKVKTAECRRERIRERKRKSKRRKMAEERKEEQGKDRFEVMSFCQIMTRKSSTITSVIIFQNHEYPTTANDHRFCTCARATHLLARTKI